MHRLNYTGESFYIADEVCSALMNYAAILGKAGSSDVVSIPVVDEAGLQTQAELLIGPASQLMSSAVEHMREEAFDPAVVTDLKERTEEIRRSMA